MTIKEIRNERSIARLEEMMEQTELKIIELKADGLINNVWKDRNAKIETMTLELYSKAIKERIKKLKTSNKTKHEQLNPKDQVLVTLALALAGVNKKRTANAKYYNENTSEARIEHKLIKATNAQIIAELIEKENKAQDENAPSLTDQLLYSDPTISTMKTQTQVNAEAPKLSDSSSNTLSNLDSALDNELKQSLETDYSSFPKAKIDVNKGTER